LPSTRTLASNLGISRTTVVLAFDQLLREGYVEGKKGSGTYVASELPEALLQKPVSTSMRSTVHARTDYYRFWFTTSH
jgi:GntR family transcriptional regulator / MocR family aminotransferase